MGRGSTSQDFINGAALPPLRDPSPKDVLQGFSTFHCSEASAQLNIHSV